MDFKKGGWVLRARGLTWSRVVLLASCSGAVTACNPAAPGEVAFPPFGGVGLGPGEFSYPRAIATEPNGSVFVVDKDARVQRFSRLGAFETFWRMPEKAQGKPVGLSVHPDSRIFVADTHYHRVLIFNRDGRLLGSFGEEGKGPGQFMLPTDVAFDREGRIYVGEYYLNDRITRWSPSLEYELEIGAAPIEGARLSRPAGIDVDEEGTLWVADACNHRIVRFSCDGAVLKVFGKMGSGSGELHYPYGLDVSPDDRAIMVCEYGGNRLQWFDKKGRSLGIWGAHGQAPGQLWSPWGAAYGPEGLIYVVDSLNSRIQAIRQPAFLAEPRP